MLGVLCELIIMSLSGALMYAFSLLFKGRRNAMARYAMLIAAVAVMLVPFGLIKVTPRLFSLELPQGVVRSAGYVSAGSGGADTAGIVTAVIFTVWAAGAAVSLAKLIRGYARTARVIKRVSRRTLDGRIIGIYKSVCQTLGITEKTEIYMSRHLKSPLLFGLLRQRIVLPDREFADEELRLIMMHELVHYMHGDLWVEAAAAAARCVHWFNPCAYMICAAAAETRELCCDETVLAAAGLEDNKDYGRIIISVMEDGAKRPLAYTTAMASPGKTIRKRLMKIARFSRPSRMVRLIGFAAVMACFAVSVTAFGFTWAAETVPTEITRRMASEIKGGVSPVGAIADAVSRAVFEEDTAQTDAPYDSGILPEPTEEDVPEVSAANAAAEPAETVLPAGKSESPAAPAVVSDETVEEAYPNDSYSFTMEEYADPGDRDMPEVTAIPESGAISEPIVYSLPGSAYIFTPDTAVKGEIMSDDFYASEDIRLSVAYQGVATVRLYDAADGRLIHEVAHDDRSASFSMDMPEGSRYYLTMEYMGDGYAGDSYMGAYIRAL